MAIRIPQPPRNKGGKTDPLEVQRWLDSVWRFLVSAAGVVWGTINFTGSQLSDIESRPHSDLQGTTTVGVHPHEALNNLDGPSVHPHSSIYNRNEQGQHDVYAVNFPATAVTTTYTVLNTDFLILADASGGDFTVTLPPAASLTGNILDVKNTGATGTVTVDGDGSETIDDGTTFDLIPYETITVLSDGTEWWII